VSIARAVEGRKLSLREAGFDPRARLLAIFLDFCFFIATRRMNISHGRDVRT